MIRYHVTQADLEHRVDQHAPGWRADADARTQRFIAAGQFDETSHSWSEVKAVFMRLQHEKCAYCERQLAGEDHGGAAEHDLEHFRPKSSVDPWPGGAAFKLTADTVQPQGYYWLAYHLSNYCVACKTCNNYPQKGTYFPVRNARVIDHALSPTELDEREKPLLVNPVGDRRQTDDPAGLITFSGLTAAPVKQSGANRTRAKAIITFFRLNREDLRRGRANVIVALSVCLQTARSRRVPPAQRAEAEEAVGLFTSASAPHSSCAAAFERLFNADRATAKRLARDARRFLQSVT